jgi:hypothetical protein
MQAFSGRADFGVAAENFDDFKRFRRYSAGFRIQAAIQVNPRIGVIASENKA